MTGNSGKSNESASEQIFSQVEDDMEPGGVRDLWWGLRQELAEGGPEGVRTYLESEYEGRRAIVQHALEELSNQLEETT